MHWSADVRISCDDFVSYLVPTKRNTRAPIPTTSTQCGSVHLKNSFVLRYNIFFLLHSVPVTLTRSILICQLVQVGGSRKVDIWNNVSKQRYVTIRDILLPFVTLRYEALRNRFSLGIFHDTCKRGYYSRYPRMQQGWSDDVIFFYVTTWSRI